jgi:hypothetical protein
MEGKFKMLFFNLEETIQHLFFDCQMAKIMWRIVQVSF